LTGPDPLASYRLLIIVLSIVAMARVTRRYLSPEQIDALKSHTDSR